MYLRVKLTHKEIRRWGALRAAMGRRGARGAPMTNNQLATLLIRDQLKKVTPGSDT